MKNKVNYFPVFERVIGVSCDLNLDEWEEKDASWRSLAKQEFSREETITNWNFTVDQKKDSPPESIAEVETKFRLWKDRSGVPVWCMQSRKDGFYINLHREAGNLHDYEELLEMFNQWVGRWVEHFNPKSIKKVALHYVNILNEETVPGFFNAEGALEIERIATLSGYNATFPYQTSPYNIDISYAISGSDFHSILRHNLSIQETKSISARMDLSCLTGLNQMNLKVDQITDAMTCSHNILQQAFDEFFTKEAQRAFKKP